MGIRWIIRLFENGNTITFGMRGKGKDLLMSNVVARRKLPYVGNIDYNCEDSEYHKLDFDKIDAGGNTYENFIEGDVLYYEYPYPDGSDVYISDAGIYLPAQYSGQLDRRYPYLPTYLGLSRQLSHNNVHVNTQSLNRIWNKLREQTDAAYIMCNWCVYLFGLVIQKVTIYDKYQSAVDRVRPARIQRPLFNKDAQMQADIYLDKFRNTYGSIKPRLLIYFNKSNYDTYHFKEVLKNGKKIKKT